MKTVKKICEKIFWIIEVLKIFIDDVYSSTLPPPHPLQIVIACKNIPPVNWKKVKKLTHMFCFEVLILWSYEGMSKFSRL